MKAPAPALLSVLLPGCVSLAQLSSDEYFFAYGTDPDWSASIGTGEIRLAIGHPERHQTSPLEVHSFPVVPAHVLSDGYAWESLANGHSISIKSRRRACRLPNGIRLSRTVRVRLDNRQFEGCGGRQTMVRG